MLQLKPKIDWAVAIWTRFREHESQALCRGGNSAFAVDQIHPPGNAIGAID
jgi:hypothetical protein